MNPHMNHKAHNLIDLTGHTFGRLTVIRKAPSVKRGQARWLCRCSCGEERVILSQSLRSGLTKSCGCLQRERVIEHNKAMTGDKHPRPLLGKKGKDHPKWKGAYRPRSKLLRHEMSKELDEWRLSVFRRDGFTCQVCLEPGRRLNAHHIRPFMGCEEGRLDSDNGITLCEKCHRFTHKMLGGRRLL